VVGPVEIDAACSDDPELRRVLRALARERSVASYAELAELVGQPGPHRIHGLTARLEALARADMEAGRPMLAALAVGRNGTLPQRGFFLLLTELGCYEGPEKGPEAEAFHREELELAWEWWGAQER